MSSGELLETPPRAPSSPSAASLQLKPEPLAVEMGGKSSSAPLLENNDAKNVNGKVPVSFSLFNFEQTSGKLVKISGASTKEIEIIHIKYFLHVD